MKPFGLAQTPPGPPPTYSQVLKSEPARSPQRPAPAGTMVRLNGRAALRPPLSLPRPPQVLASGYQASQMMLRHLEGPLRKQYEALSSRLNGPLSLATAEEAYRKNLSRLTQTFERMLATTNNYTCHVEHLPKDLDLFLTAHLQHSRALLASEAALGKSTFSFLKFAHLPGYHKERAILKVPIEGREHSFVPQSHELLSKLLVQCPLPALRSQVSVFYETLAQLAVARSERCGSAGIRKMFDDVAQLWRSFAEDIQARA